MTNAVILPWLLHMLYFVLLRTFRSTNLNYNCTLHFVRNSLQVTYHSDHGALDQPNEQGLKLAAHRVHRTTGTKYTPANVETHWGPEVHNPWIDN